MRQHGQIGDTWNGGKSATVLSVICANRLLILFPIVPYAQATNIIMGALSGALRTGDREIMQVMYGSDQGKTYRQLLISPCSFASQRKSMRKWSAGDVFANPLLVRTLSQL